MADPFAPPVESALEQLPLRRTRGYRILTLVLSLLAITVAVASVAFAYAFAEAYGRVSTPADFDWLPVLVLAGTPGVLLGAAVTMLAGLRDRSAPIWVTIPLAVALMWVATGWQADAGARQHVIDDAVIAAACSPEEIAVLDSMSGYGIEYGAAQGQKNGDCAAWIMVKGDDPKAAMTELGWELGMDGWTLGSGDWRNGVWVKSYVGVRVTHIQSSDGTTGVGLVVVNAT